MIKRDPSLDSNAIDDEEEIFQDEQGKNEEMDDELGSDGGMEDDDKSKRKMIEGYPEQNLLYRLLK